MHLCLLTIQEILQLSTTFLEQKGMANARREAEEVLSIALNLPRIELYLNFDKPLLEEELKRCREILKRRASGEPIAYIRGFVPFYNCEISLTPDVLIPRFETEILVDHFCKQLGEEKIIFDLCTGSGCIAIALKKRFPHLKVVASDLSSEAIKVAKQNAENNGVDITFLEGDFLDVLHEKVDAIICNPPYVSEIEFQALEPSVASYEPKIALLAKEEGYFFYRQLAENAKNFLNQNGKIWLEIGCTQGSKVKELFDNSGWKSTKVEKDYSSHDRFFFGAFNFLLFFCTL